MFHIIPYTCPRQITCIESPKYISLSPQPRCMRALIPNMSLNPFRYSQIKNLTYSLGTTNGNNFILN